jgi:ankyrin repeat protein
LIGAAKYNHPDIVKVLLSKGADVNLKTKRDRTALDVATESDSSEAAQLLKEAGAKE